MSRSSVDMKSASKLAQIRFFYCADFFVNCNRRNKYLDEQKPIKLIFKALFGVVKSNLLDLWIFLINYPFVYHVLLMLFGGFLDFRSRSIARSVSRNWVPVADIKRRLADAFITRNKWVNEVMAITHDGILNCKLRSMQFLIWSM